MAAMGNSNSAACAANFAPTLDAAAGETITLGAGCYWGTEKFYRKDFQKLFPASVTFTAVGFMGPQGSVANPSYEAVCSGATGHVEVLHFKIDPAKASFEDACRFFFSFHDPTTPNRQGNDKGTQYASAIFYHSDAQRATAERVIADLNARLANRSLSFSGRPFEKSVVSTGVLPATTFYSAEKYHQQYLEHNPSGYCNHGIRFKWNDQAAASL